MEEAIDGGRFACAMLKKGKLHISSIGEIVTRAESYDDAKKDAHIIIPAKVPEEALAQMRKISEKMYHAVDGKGIARVDFFMEKSGRVLFDEFNTMPDAMYPMAWEEEGMSKTEWMDILISLALEGDIHG